jgi:hypothetical protein
MREAILASVETYEIIEKYPEDKYMPSYLIYTKYDDQVIHIQIAIDVENDNVRIVTTYKPTLDKWEDDLKTRRKS